MYGLIRMHLKMSKGDKNKYRGRSASYLVHNCEVDEKVIMRELIITYIVRNFH